MKRRKRRENWIYESDAMGHYCLDVGFEVRRVSYCGRSRFQKIEVFQTDQFGKILFLDGFIQTTEADEFAYHEMIVHLPLFSHPNPEKVIIIGGGDGGVLREVLKHKTVKSAVMVEIDQKVIEVSKKYLPELSAGAFDSKRVKIIIDDGVRYIQNTSEKFDVAIVDSSDPAGPANVLYSKKFYQSVFSALLPEGMAIYQSGTSFFQKSEIKNIYRRNKSIFSYVSVALLDVPTYLIGNIALTLASKKINPVKINLKKIQKRYKKLKLKTRYYNPEIHLASFVLPDYLREILK